MPCFFSGEMATGAAFIRSRFCEACAVVRVAAQATLRAKRSREGEEGLRAAYFRPHPSRQLRVWVASRLGYYFTPMPLLCCNMDVQVRGSCGF